MIDYKVLARSNGRDYTEYYLNLLKDEKVKESFEELSRVTKELAEHMVTILPPLTNVIVDMIKQLKKPNVCIAGSLHPNKKLLQIALHGKNRRIRKKNEDRLLRWLAGYEVENDTNHSGRNPYYSNQNKKRRHQRGAA